jgi:sugar O-acyltransferase (sialic acid O-acetyltransferase NeuD family)
VKPPFPDVPIFFGEAGFHLWRKENAQRPVAGLVTIGGNRGNARLSLQRFLEDHGVSVIIAVHPTAFVASNARISKGSQLLARSCVCAEAVIGEACIINTAASVDHESVLGDGVHIGPGATLAGCVEVGSGAFIGAGAVVLPRIRIGRNALVGAGSVVTRDIADGRLACGNPARIRGKAPGEES